MYHVVDGRLVLRETRDEVRGWDPAELAAYVRRIEALLDAGGVALGAWDGARLVGLGTLDVRGVGGDGAVLKLDMLYVDAGHRHRGIGRVLTQRLAAEASARGARALYVSATPTRNTVDAYLRMGARLHPSPDPELLALEPDDVHLLVDVRSQDSGRSRR